MLKGILVVEDTVQQQQEKQQCDIRRQQFLLLLLLLLLLVGTVSKVRPSGAAASRSVTPASYGCNQSGPSRIQLWKK